MAERPLKIVLANFHEGWGGQAAYVLALARGLVSAGHGVVVACPPESELDRRAREAGLAVFTKCSFRGGFRPLAFIREVRAMGRFLNELGADIVHSHGSQDCWRAALARRQHRPGCRHVRTKHNSYPVAGHPANRWLFRRGIDRLVVVAGALKPLLGKILPPERIDILHAPVADLFFEKVDGAPFRAELGLGPEVPLVGVVARLAADKGQADVLRALVELRKRIPNVLVAMVGVGPERERLSVLARELDVGAQVRFLGERRDVPAITAALSVSVLASTDCDASSTVVKEALAAGCPVVATEVGGIREIVEDGVTGRIVPPGRPEQLAAAIAETLADRGRARAQAEAGRRVMRERFSEAAFVAGQLAIYRSVLGGDPASPRPEFSVVGGTRSDETRGRFITEESSQARAIVKERQIQPRPPSAAGLESCPPPPKTPPPSLHLPILMYHQIASPGPGDKPGLFVPPALFREQMRFLAERGYRAVGPDAVQAALTGTPVELPPRSMLVTFDDTVAGRFGPALEILAEFEFPAVGYFIAGDAKSMPGPRDLDDYRRLGFTVGSHCVTHPWMPDLSPGQLRTEVVDSRRRLEDLCGAPVVHFAYPHGGYGPREVAAVGEAGYRTAVSTRRGNRQKLSEILCLRRLPMRPDTGLPRVGHFLGSLWHWEHILKEALGIDRKNLKKSKKNRP